VAVLKAANGWKYKSTILEEVAFDAKAGISFSFLPPVHGTCYMTDCIPPHKQHRHQRQEQMPQPFSVRLVLLLPGGVCRQSGGERTLLCDSKKENFSYVKSVIIIHVGCTRCVTSSTDNIMKIHARITLTVEFIRTCIFYFYFMFEYNYEYDQY